MDINKFSWKELFNNNNGKTSGSGASGIALVAIAILTILNINVLIYFNPPFAIKLMEQIVYVILISSSLLGVRKWVSKDELKDISKTIDASTGI